MGSFRLAACATVALMLEAAPVRAQAFITPFLGYSFGGDAANCVSLTNCNEKRLNMGVAFGTARGVFGFEEDIAYAPSFFGKAPTGDNGVLTAMSNLLVVVPIGPIRPYGLVGIGLVRPHVNFDPARLALDKNALGYDIGGGVNVFFTRHVGLRGDIRHFHTLQDVKLVIFSGDKLDFWRASAGLTFLF